MSKNTKSSKSSMNLYIRYFESEILVTDVEDAISFLASVIPDFSVNGKIADDVRSYFNSSNNFPKRYKIRPKNYFIMIKTGAKTMQEFKEYRADSISKAFNEAAAEEDNAAPESPAAEEYQEPAPQPPVSRRDRVNPVITALYAENPGWYEGDFTFKRVVVLPSTGKNEYRDTHFVARCKAGSGIECYKRIIEHLSGRVDSRSQFPSAKGKNFTFTYLGECKPVTAS